MTTTFRLFVALSLPEQHRTFLARLAEKLRQQWPFSHWIDPRDYHITLQFLGPCSAKKMALIQKRLQQLGSQQSPFHLQIDGLGTFGMPQKPRIIWAGVGGQQKELHQLQRKVVDSMLTLGFKKEQRPYQPHITLAKNYLRQDFPSSKLHLVNTNFLDWPVQEITLYRSHLKRKPMYEKVGRFPLDGSHATA